MDDNSNEKPYFLNPADVGMTGGIAAEFHNRLSALEAANVSLRAELEAAKTAGTVGLDTAHVNHVMMKHFYQDRPDADDASKTGSRLGG